MNEMLKKIAVERPTGTNANETVNAFIEEEFRALGLEIVSIPFDCDRWAGGASELLCGENKIELLTSPFSRGCHTTAALVCASTIEELQNAECSGNILLLSGALCAEQLQPKDYPFYYPDEHRALIELLEKKNPAAIIAITGKSAMCGLEPFPLFSDGNFLIPSAYASAERLPQLRGFAEKNVSLSINSQVLAAKSRQLTAKSAKNAEGKKILICAHMDSQYDTPAALDNATGVAVLLKSAKKLANSGLNVEFVPFNGEEYYRASGELAYLSSLSEADRPALVINIDSPCHAGSNVAAAFFNLDEQQKASAASLISGQPRACEGEQWYSGDHAMFAFQGVPCVAVSSGDIFTGGLCDTHTPRDTIEKIDETLLETASALVSALARAL